MKVVTTLMQDLQSKVSTVSGLGNKVVAAVSVEDLIHRVQHLPKPCAGILYGGAKAQPNTKGMSADSEFSIILLVDGATVSKIVDTTTPAHDLLDAIRLAIQQTRSPSGHLWEFEIEGAVSLKGAQSVWLQRWKCPIQLPRS